MFIPVVFVAYGALILSQSLRGPDTQPRLFLGNGEVPGQVWMVIGAILVGSAFSDLLIVLVRGVGLAHWQPWIITLFSVGNLILIGVLSLSDYLEAEPADPDEVATRIPADPTVWAAVQDYMADARPYLDPDLTLAKLARKLASRPRPSQR